MSQASQLECSQFASIGLCDVHGVVRIIMDVMKSRIRGVTSVVVDIVGFILDSVSGMSTGVLKGSNMGCYIKALQ